jgi:hypothetical protein
VGRFFRPCGCESTPGCRPRAAPSRLTSPSPSSERVHHHSHPDPRLRRVATHVRPGPPARQGPENDWFRQVCSSGSTTSTDRTSSSTRTDCSNLRARRPTGKGREVTAEAQRLLPARGMPDAVVDGEDGVGNRAGKVVLHRPGDDGIGIAADQERWCLDVRELAQVVVLAQPRECPAPDVRRNLEELCHEQIDQVRLKADRRRLGEEGPCEVRRDRVLQLRDERLSESPWPRWDTAV